nr:eukaryotic translation initiation factor 1A, X-chromosomal-like [Oryctolagus cuniculus]
MQVSMRKDQTVSEEEEEEEEELESESDAEVECDLSNMEITEELRRYFATTEKHREERQYAQVIKMLGNGRLEAMCFDGVKRLCHIRGKLRKKVWINTSDIILIGLREYQDNKADVILKYNADEARSLKAYGELPEHAKINETDTFGPGDDDEIQFDDIGDDDEDIDDI